MIRFLTTDPTIGSQKNGAISEYVQKFAEEELIADRPATLPYSVLLAELRNWMMQIYHLRPDPNFRRELKRELIHRSGAQYSIDNDELIGVRLKTNDERAEEEAIMALFDDPVFDEEEPIMVLFDDRSSVGLGWFID